tara:strand:+ start:2265 stop:3221 length:957 start_codon:yes stop_codon:yes gene_type:complete
MNYIELFGSREVSRSGNSYTASRTFLVYEDTGTLTLEDAVNYDGGVSFSNQHPDIGGIFANGFTIKASGARANTWELTWTYAQPQEPTDAGGDDDEHDDDGDNTEIDPVDGGVFDPPDSGGGDDNTGGGEDDQGDDGVGDNDDGGEDDGEDETERLFTGVSITTGLALVDGYVAGATVPSQGSQGGDSGFLIYNGTIVHQGGEPVTVPVPTTDISLSVTTFGTTFHLNDVQLKAGKRNASAFYGFKSGSVLFKGMSVSRQTENSWDSTFNFVWDEWSHMRQIPNRDAEGNIAYESDGTTLNIYYKQPFPDTTSFAFSP